jgi:hypothetical protein
MMVVPDEPGFGLELDPAVFEGARQGDRGWIVE